ncbi:hypothetical protein L7F22_013694 [Adiantum nelumboides]|nr:hypothetical protein [Adiantum nelumboides]
MTTLSSSLLRQRCTTCFRSAASIIPNQNQASPSAPTLQRCSACRIVRYCSSSCQAKDWKDHKNECKAFRSYGESARKTRKENGKPELREGDPLDEPGTSVRTLARLIWAKQREEKNWWSQVMTMQSHRTSLTAEQLQPMGQLSMELAYFLGAGEADDSSSRSEDQAKKLSDLGFSNAVEL